MNGEVEYPDIRYVVYPVHLDGTLTGGPPAMRHDPDCGHFRFGGGKILGSPILATDEQMRMLRACQDCATRRSDSSGSQATRQDGKLGELCPTCHQTMSLTGVCDNCN